MSEKESYIIFVVVASTVAIIILLLAVIDLMLLYRHRKLKHKTELEEQKRKVDQLLQQQEVDAVNAMLKGQDNERKRIAQELHDRLGSILSTIKLHFSSVEEQMQMLKEQQNKSYGEARLLLDEAVDEVRRISHDLYEGSLARFGFKTALLQLIDAIEKANAIKIIFIDNNIDGVFYKAFEQELYRITQELLSNSLKYSGAKEITIQLTHLNGCFKYMYEDNGKGFDTKILEVGQGIGYKNIAARVAKINGNWHLDSLPGHGMTLLIEITDETH
jgi:two-component system, NarL family, sensor kinase